MGFRSPLLPMAAAVPARPEPDVLPWAIPWPFGRRCRATLEPGHGPHHGRCDLAAEHRGDHALERGFETPRWSTNLTGY